MFIWVGVGKNIYTLQYSFSTSIQKIIWTDSTSFAFSLHIISLVRATMHLSFITCKLPNFPKLGDLSVMDRYEWYPQVTLFTSSRFISEDLHPGCRAKQIRPIGSHVCFGLAQPVLGSYTTCLLDATSTSGPLMAHTENLLPVSQHWRITTGIRSAVEELSMGQTQAEDSGVCWVRCFILPSPCTDLLWFLLLWEDLLIVNKFFLMLTAQEKPLPAE